MKAKVLVPAAMLFCLSGMSSCAADATSARAEVPRVEVPVFFDPGALHARTAHPLLAGDRMLLSVPLGDSAGVIPIADVQVSDTSVVAIDASGMMYANAAGTAWIRWRRSDAGIADSAKVTVQLEPDPPSPEQGWTTPALPAKVVDIGYPRGRSRGEVAGRSITVGPNGNLQAALNDAQPGDEIVLANGATWTGNFVLPKKSGTGWIVVRGEQPPVAGTRAVTPNSAATIITNNTAAAITAAPGAHHWRLVGFNVRLAPIAADNGNIIRLNTGFEGNVAELASDIVLDRMIISGSPSGGTKRCVALNSIRTAIIDSQLLECHALGSDAQAIGGWGGPGPYLIENNRLEGSGETVMFGGADAVISGMVPSDITIRRNYFTRPLSWAGKWTIKNILELKNARRVLIEGNVMENNWADAQVGFAILLKAVSQDDRAPWSTMQDITIRQNVVRNSLSGINIAYRTTNVPLVGTSRVLILNNVFENVGRDPVSGNLDGRMLQLLGETIDVTYAQNTSTLTGVTSHAVSFDGGANVRTTLLNNVFPESLYGFKGGGTGVGTATLSAFAPGSTVGGNVMPGQGPYAAEYPSNTFFAPIPGIAGQPAKEWEALCSDVRAYIVRERIPATVGAVCTNVVEATRGVVKGSPN